MIKLHSSLFLPGCAQGNYTVKAKGCILAILRWGNANAPFDDWGSFAYVPIDPAGNGFFSFTGVRGIPREATHVWARCYAADFSSYEDGSAPIPAEFLDQTEGQGWVHHFSVLTDLHLAAKPWKIKQALQATKSDMVFLLGDSTNDGLPEQFAEFRACIRDVAEGKTILPVPGNHDITHPRFIGKETDGSLSYADFQKALLENAKEKGCVFTEDPSSLAWAMQLGGLDLIGLQCVVSQRKFLFPGGGQIDWLEEHLASTPAARHIILCHAPLLAHNPNRNIGAPYLDKNNRIQDILDRNGRILFLSGHTHVSPNVLTGNAEYDVDHQNIYLDCGSVVPTDTSDEKGLMPPDWRDGCKTELTVREDMVEISMSSLSSGIHFPRGYYRFYVGDDTYNKKMKLAWEESQRRKRLG